MKITCFACLMALSQSGFCFGQKKASAQTIIPQPTKPSRTVLAEIVP